MYILLLKVTYITLVIRIDSQIYSQFEIMILNIKQMKVKVKFQYYFAVDDT
jgi:hypothetical protein